MHFYCRRGKKSNATVPLKIVNNIAPHRRPSQNTSAAGIPDSCSCCSVCCCCWRSPNRKHCCPTMPMPDGKTRRGRGCRRWRGWRGRRWKWWAPPGSCLACSGTGRKVRRRPCWRGRRLSWRRRRSEPQPRRPEAWGEGRRPWWGGCEAKPWPEIMDGWKRPLVKPPPFCCSEQLIRSADHDGGVGGFFGQAAHMRWWGGSCF